MNTRPIPIIITLSAAGVSCVVSIAQEVGFAMFLIRLAMTVGLFYVIGMVVALLLMRAFGNPGDSEVIEEEEVEEAESAEGESTEDNPEEGESSEEPSLGEEFLADEQFTPMDYSSMEFSGETENINMEQGEAEGAGMASGPYNEEFSEGAEGAPEFDEEFDE